ncbi:MAG TPA: N-acetylmuramoyl-L-alanine amidase [Saprospiraceae bacterium]|nr:N-acetylmuramoyl-L-alanine amidase [Saprospiraceae bacterium]
MKSNFVLQTFTLLIAWLLFENFNLSTGAWTHQRWEGSSDRKSTEASANHYAAAPIQDNSGAKNFSAAPKPPYKIKTIVLDAGHGGKDPGCVGPSAFEKDNTLAIVLRLGAYIEENYPEIKVIYTRDTDVFIELNERAAIANRNNADLFISVHCNALPGKPVQGAETYVLGLHRSKDNLDVAKRENASIYLEDDYQKNYAGYDPESPEAEIFASLWQSAYLEQSILFASYVQQFASAVAFREDRGVKQAGFLVLRETAMPSVLVEAGYLTNAAEDAFLASEEGREQVALAIFQAFEAYKRHMETGKPLDNVAEAPAPKKTPQTKPAPQKTQVPVTAGNDKKTTAATTSPPVTTTPKATPVSNKTTQPTTTKSKPAVNTPVQEKPVVKQEPVYAILLLAWPNKLDPNVGQLSLMSNVKEKFHDGKYHYYSGRYTSKADAEKVLPEIHNMGFKTASIVQQ